MSTYYRPVSTIPFDAVFDGRLNKYGLREEISADSTENRRDIVGPDGILTVHREEDGGCRFSFTIYKSGLPWAVFDALGQEFEVEIVSEYEPQYWGFDTQEEWDAFNRNIAQEHRNEFYDDLLNYIQGKPHDIGPGTIGMIQAKIAKNLVNRDPELLAPEKRDVLLEAIERIYDRDHAVKVTLSKHDIAAVDMILARANKAPKA